MIDLYQIHWPEPPEDIDEGWQTMVKLKEEGKVRWIGVSNFSAEQMAQVSQVRADHVAPAAVLDDPPRGRGASILPYCLANNIGVIAYFADGQRACSPGR